LTGLHFHLEAEGIGAVGLFAAEISHIGGIAAILAEMVDDPATIKVPAQLGTA
jgi:hypothetical protein